MENYMTAKQKIAKTEDSMKNSCLSVKSETHKKYIEFLTVVNTASSEINKDLKKINMNDLLDLLSDHLTDKIKTLLMEKRLTGQSKQKLFRNRYESLFGKLSDDKWAEILMSSSFQKFKKENIDCLQFCNLRSV